MYIDVSYVVPLAEKGICISTVSLWILLVYTEASLRLKDLKISSANLSHLFAAHWYVVFVDEHCVKKALNVFICGSHMIIKNSRPLFTINKFHRTMPVKSILLEV